MGYIQETYCKHSVKTMKLKVYMLCLIGSANCIGAIDSPHIVNVTVPIPAMTNIIAGLSRDKRFIAKPVIAKGVDLAKYMPDQHAVDLVAHSDVYLSLGLPFEDDLCKRALQINKLLKCFPVTNGCNTIDRNMYVWLSMDNLDVIRDNVKRCLIPKEKSFSWSCMSLKDQYKNLGLTVALAHPAFEYPCNYFGLRYVRLYDAEGNLKRGSIENVNRKSKVSFALALEHQASEMAFLASKGFDVGSIDAGDTEALVQFAKCIRNAVVKEEDKILQEEEKESERRNERLDAKGGPHGH